jgi:hypothetical protein
MGLGSSAGPVACEEGSQEGTDGSFDILSERQVEHDGGLKQARHGRDEFA